jgi:hypothetical protein
VGESGDGFGFCVGYTRGPGFVGMRFEITGGVPATSGATAAIIDD